MMLAIKIPFLTHPSTLVLALIHSWKFWYPCLAAWIIIQKTEPLALWTCFLYFLYLYTHTRYIHRYLDKSICRYVYLCPYVVCLYIDVVVSEAMHGPVSFLSTLTLGVNRLKYLSSPQGNNAWKNINVSLYHCFRFSMRYFKEMWSSHHLYILCYLNCRKILNVSSKVFIYFNMPLK